MHGRRYNAHEVRGGPGHCFGWLYSHTVCMKTLTNLLLWLSSWIKTSVRESRASTFWSRWSYHHSLCLWPYLPGKTQKSIPFMRFPMWKRDGRMMGKVEVVLAFSFPFVCVVKNAKCRWNMWVVREGLYGSDHKTLCNTLQGPHLPPYAGWFSLFPTKVLLYSS